MQNAEFLPLHYFCTSFYIPPDILFSPLGNSKTLEKLIERVGKQYNKSKKAKQFIFDLLQLDTPKLFQHTPQSTPETDTDSPAKIFTAYLRNYVSVCAVRGHLLTNYTWLMVSELFKLMLILMMHTIVTCIFTSYRSVLLLISISFGC